MAKRSRSASAEGHDLIYDPDRYPYQCLQAINPPHKQTCRCCSFVSVGTTAMQTATAMSMHMNYHRHQEAGVCVTRD